MISEDILSTEYLGQDKPVNKISPVVSVCVITYNHAPFIRECLDSILMQETDFPFEIIIGEDNSTDGTRDICKEYAEKHPDKIRLFLRRPDQKIEVRGETTFHFNLIEVLNASRGIFIALCEGDDSWTINDKLQKQADELGAEQTISVVFHDVEVFKQNQFFTDHLVEPKWKGRTQFSFEDLLSMGNFMHTCSVMFRKSAIPNVDFLRGVPIGDIFIYMMVLQQGHAQRLPLKMAIYRIHEGGMWSMKDNSYEKYLIKLHQFRLLKQIKHRQGLKIVYPKLKGLFKKHARRNKVSVDVFLALATYNPSFFFTGIKCFFK
jgi:glycosyltransferase involved in cell wall biosynthesis